MNNQDPDEDLFQQSIKGRGRMARGMINTSYDSVPKFVFAFCIALGLFFTGLVFCFYSLKFFPSIQETGGKIFTSIFSIFFIFLVMAMSIKIFYKLFNTIKEKESKFRKKVFLGSLLPIIISIFILIEFIQKIIKLL